jgi:hypothetical protein
VIPRQRRGRHPGASSTPPPSSTPMQPSGRWSLPRALPRTGRSRRMCSSALQYILMDPPLLGLFY